MTAWINEASSVWWPWMTGMFWQVGLLILLVSLVDWAFGRRMWPQVRYAMWLVILIKLVIPPTWSSPYSLVSRIRPHIQNIFVEKTQSHAVAFETPAATVQKLGNTRESTAFDDHQTVRRDSPMPTALPDTQPAISPKAKAMLIWISGMIIFGLLLILKMARLRRWHDHRREEEIPDWFHRLMVDTARKLGLSRIPAIVFSKDAVTPAVYGLFRPVLLLPAGYANQLSREEAEHVLLHELCHLKRGDLLMHGFYLILNVVYWFNPLLLWTRRQMKHVREICCDLSVAAVLRDKTQNYRQTLLETARELLTKNVEPGMGLLGVFEEPFRLVSRLKWLEKETWKFRKRAFAASVLVCALLVVLVIPMSASEPNAAQEPSAVPINASGIITAVKTDSTQSIPDFSVKLKMTEAFTAVILPKQGSPTPQLEAAMNELMQLIKKQGIDPTGQPFFRIWSDPKTVPESQLIWEVGCPVKEEEEPEAPLEFIRASGQQVASATVEGMLETEPVWEDFTKRIENMGLVPAFPPAVEWYRTEEKGKPFWWKTELQMQAFQPRQGYPGMDIKIRKSEPALAVVLPVHGSYNQFKASRDRVLSYMKDHDVPTSGEWISVNFSDPSKVKPSEYLWEIGCIVNTFDSLRIDPPFVLRSYQSDTVATTEFEGPPDTEFPFTPFVMQAFFQGYFIKGPAILTWKDKPKQNIEDVKRTELSIPVMRVENFASAMEAFGRGVGESIQQTSEVESSKTKTIHTTRVTEPIESSDSYDTVSVKGNINLLGKLGDWFKRLSEPSDSRLLFRIEERPASWALVLRATGSLDQQLVAFETLRQYMTANGIQTSGYPYTGQYYSQDIVPAYEASWEAGYSVTDSMAVKPPFQIKRIPAGRVITLHYTTSLDQKTLNVQIASWLYHHNYKPLMPNRIYWTNGIPKLLSGFFEADVEIPIQSFTEPLPEVRFTTRTERERLELILPMTGSLKQKDDAITKLKKYVQKNDLETTGDVFVQYHTTPEITPDSEMVWDVGIPIRWADYIDDPFKVEKSHGRLTACATWTGDPHHVPDAIWFSFTLNFTMNGYLAAGYPREVYKEALPNGQWRMELQWPVRQ